MSKMLTTIGRAESVKFPGLLNIAVPAKSDTGAYRSAVHAQNIKVITDDSGNEVLEFDILGHPAAPVSTSVRTPKFSQITVISSNGDAEQRYEVKLKLELGGLIFTTSFSLADRSGNVFPILIGRRALKRRFLVDVSKTHVNRKALLIKHGITEPRDVEDLED